MFTLNQNQATAESWVPRGTDAIRQSGLCIGVTRMSWGIAPLGASALIAYHAARDAGHIKVTNAAEVPKGAICYGLHGEHGQAYSKYGHAWLAKGASQCYSTDYGGTGTWTVQQVALTRWTGVSTVTWTNWTPFGMLPLVAIPAPPKPPPAPGAPGWRQGKKIYASKMHLGQQNSDSVWNVTVGLHAHGFWPYAYSDDFGNTLRGAVGNFQRAQGWKGQQADGIPGPLTVQRLGGIYVNA